MVNYRELISSFSEEDYRENHVNLHIHTTYSDGEADFEDIVKQADEKGYKYIAISDHNTMNGYLETGIVRDYLIPAVEFDVWCGYVFCHVLGYGINPINPAIKPFFGKKTNDFARLFPHRNFVKLIEAIHASGGIAVLAHPACYWALSLDKFFARIKELGIDGVECYYPYDGMRGIIKFHHAGTVTKLAEKYNFLKTGGTDLHGKILDNFH